MLLQAMTAPAPVSSQPTVQAYAVALRHTMPAVYVAAQDRHTHAGTVPWSVTPLTAVVVVAVVVAVTNAARNSIEQPKRALNQAPCASPGPKWRPRFDSLIVGAVVSTTEAHGAPIVVVFVSEERVCGGGLGVTQKGG